MKPKLLVLTSTLPRFPGDPEPCFVLHLAQALTGRYAVTVLAPLDPGAQERESVGEIEIRRYRYAPFRAWETLAYPGGIMPRLRAQPWRWIQVPWLMVGLFRVIRRLHREQVFDLVHAHWIIPQGLASLLALGTGEKAPPVVVTSHGGDLHTLANGPVRALLRWVLRHAAGVTLVSAPLIEIVDHVLRSGPGPRNMAMIPMGVDTMAFGSTRPDPDWAARNRLVSPVILFVGRLAEKKGLTYLLGALGQPALRDLEFQVAIIGDGPLRGDLERQCRQQGLNGRVRFLGARSYVEISVGMASAEILAAPSVRASDGDCEGLPTVILEAMASGLPVVTTPNGGITLVVEDGKTGRLVPERDVDALAEALADLLRDPSQRQRLADAGRARVQDFDWRFIADRYDQVLRRALSSSR